MDGNREAKLSNVEQRPTDRKSHSTIVRTRDRG
jgi:hypothetical protein